MRRSTWCGLSLVGMLMGLAVVLAPDAVTGEERIRAGVMDLTLAGGYSVSYNATGAKGLASVDGFHLIPHFGYFLTDRHGPGWLGGNLELLAEPTLVHLNAKSESATVGGVAALGRWLFTGTSVVRPYIEAGVGVLGGNTRFRQTDCDLNFALQGGLGLLLFMSEQVALTAGYRVHHISNADSCDKNLGLNSSLFILGVSYFLP